ncbi:hypothetical protein ALQ06_200024 [Pseudomonas syringae pv. berberidis]|nr:hypothetical protein ALQ06_200024 [Pseudomonas syringae pv. berberidis]
MLRRDLIAPDQEGRPKMLGHHAAQLLHAPALAVDVDFVGVGAEAFLHLGQPVVCRADVGMDTFYSALGGGECLAGFVDCIGSAIRGALQVFKDPDQRRRRGLAVVDKEEVLQAVACQQVSEGGGIQCDLGDGVRRWPSLETGQFGGAKTAVAFVLVICNRHHIRRASGL